MALHTFTLKPSPPFRLDLTSLTLCRRPDNQIDRWDGQTYQRILVLDGEPLGVSVTQTGTTESPRLEVMLNGVGAISGVELRVKSLLSRLLGINIDLKEFYRFSESHPNLGHLVNRFRGAKPPRFPSLFETLVNAIACQQLSLTVGIRLLNHLSQAYGPALRIGEDIFHAFPRPEDLVNVEIEEFRKIGFSHRKGHYLHGLAQLIIDQQINLEEIEILKDGPATKELCQIKGVGRWTAEYFLLRGLGRTHIFPGDDVGARNNLQHWLDVPERLDYCGVRRLLTNWKEYGGLIYFQLLLKSLHEKGVAVA